jgi:hypothetical protein
MTATEMITSPLPDPDRDAEFYADVPLKRFFAWIVDAVIIGLLTAIAIPFTAFTALFYLPVLVLLVSFFYRWLTIAGGSATLGMRLVSIEFLGANGARFDGLTAGLHTLGYTVSVAVFPLQLVSMVLMVTTARRQGLTDHLLGSVAINRSARF